MCQQRWPPRASQKSSFLLFVLSIMQCNTVSKIKNHSKLIEIKLYDSDSFLISDNFLKADLLIPVSTKKRFSTKEAIQSSIFWIFIGFTLPFLPNCKKTYS